MGRWIFSYRLSGEETGALILLAGSTLSSFCGWLGSTPALLFTYWDPELENLNEEGKAQANPGPLTSH